MSSANEQPLGPRRLNLGALTDEDFEEVCFLVVRLEFPEAIKLDNPDGGADSALPSEDRATYLRCWQAKRYTEHIRWGHCKDSLDRAVVRWRMSRYTFCFARNLTEGQEKKFQTDLVGRHAGVRVDYWSHSRLESALLTSEQGERIARHFYGDPVGDAQAIARALRAGGELSSGEHAADRLSAIAEFLARHDPHGSGSAVSRVMVG